MYRLTHDHRPEMPEFEGEPIQRPEDPEELSQICGTFGLKIIKFIPDGKSRYTLRDDRAN